ncbi:unnamed protein product [Trichobilharzia regenti]|nr:unnamed protein product [Trichobilharzia regenti]
MPLSGVTPSLLDKNGKHAIIGEKSGENILKPHLSGLSTSTGRKSIFADRHHDKIQNNRKKDTGVSCSQLQQVIKRTKQILDAQELTLNSISFDTTHNNDGDDDDNNNNEGMTSYKQPTTNNATEHQIDYNDEIKSIEVNEKKKKETFSHPVSNACTLSESKCLEFPEKLFYNINASPVLCYKQQQQQRSSSTSSFSSHNSTISFVNINNNHDKCIEKKFKANNLQQSIIENFPQINEKDKDNTEEEEEEEVEQQQQLRQQQQQQNEKDDEGGDREDTTNTSVSDENNRLQRGMHWFLFFNKYNYKRCVGGIAVRTLAGHTHGPGLDPRPRTHSLTSLSQK